MGSKREAEDELDRDNWDQRADEDDEAPPSDGFRRAPQEVIARREIKAPKSRIKGAGAATTASTNAFANAFKPATAPGGMASAGFSFGSAAAKPAEGAAQFGGFSFGSAPTGDAAPKPPVFAGFSSSAAAVTPSDGPAPFSFGKPATPSFQFGVASGSENKSSQPAPTTAPTFSFAPAAEKALTFGASTSNGQTGKTNGSFVFQAPAATAEPKEPAKPAFGGFSFDSKDTADYVAPVATPITFGAPAKTDGAATPAVPTFSFGSSKPLSPAPVSLEPPKSSTPQFSFGTRPAAPAIPIFGTQPAVAPASAAEKSGPSETDMEACLSSLLGLNKAYVKFLQNEIEADDFADLEGAVTQYRDFRKGVEAKYPDVIKLLKQGGSEERTDSAVSVTPSAAALAPSIPAPAAPTFSFNNPSTPAPAFGATDSSSTQPKFSFGTPAASTAAPAAPSGTGFSFAGSSTPAAGGFKLGGFGNSEAPKFSFGTPAAGAPAFPSFGAAPSAVTVDEDGDGDDDDGNVMDDEPATDPSKFRTGAGEEEEETVFEVRSSISKMDATAKAWVKIGTGLLKVNVDKADNKARLLARTDNSTVILNQGLHSALKPELKDTNVNFVGVLDGKPQLFTLRVKTKEDAAKLKDAMEENKAK